MRILIAPLAIVNGAARRRKNRLCFWLTERERDALLTLEICPAAWPTFANRTWRSLAATGLVNFVQDDAEKTRPVLSTAAATSLTSVLRMLTSIPAASEQKT